jgi:hypothetical protein
MKRPRCGAKAAHIRTPVEKEKIKKKISSNSIIKTRRICIVSTVYYKTDTREEWAHQTVFITVDGKCLTNAALTRCTITSVHVCNTK